MTGNGGIVSEDVEVEMVERQGEREGSKSNVNDIDGDLRLYGWPSTTTEWYKRKKRLIAITIASVIFLVIVLIAASGRTLGGTCKCSDSADGGSSSPPSARRPPAKQRPTTFCAGGTGGVLKRLSREAFEYWESMNPPAQRSIIVMLADGYGPSVHSMARDVARVITKNSSLHLVLDDHLVGSSFTSALGNPITDSAAGATAYSTGRKTFNGALSVEPVTAQLISQCSLSSGGSKACPGEMGASQEKCCPVKRIAHLMEGCKAKGMATGIVVTTILPHATPAAWSSHSSARGYYDFIAQQQMEAQPPFDLLFGGGARYFDSRRADGRDLISEHSATYVFVANASALDDEVLRSGKRQKPLLGLFADDDMDYEVDRVRRSAADRQPSLKEMTRAAIKRLKATGKKYCLLVEGSRIDHALHSLDPASAARDAIAYDQAFSEALQEVSSSHDEVELLSVADHSTGGLTLGMQADFELDYNGLDAVWRRPPRPYLPSLLANTKMSTGLMASRLCCDAQFTSAERIVSFVKDNLDFTPYDEEVRLMTEARRRQDENSSCPMEVATADWPRGACGKGMQLILSKRLWQEAGTGMTTSSHTSEDIHVYAAGKKKNKFALSAENSQIGSIHLSLLDMSLDPITEALNLCQVPVHPPTLGA